MAGVLVEVTPKLTYDFTSLKDAATIEVVAAKAIPTAYWREATLLVRFWSPNQFFSFSTLKVIARTTAPTGEDPPADFISADVASVTLTSSTVGGLYTAALPANFGEHLEIVLRATQGNPGNTFIAVLSIAMSLKSDG